MSAATSDLWEAMSTTGTLRPSPSAREEVTVKLDLLTPGIEVGVVTTNLDEMVAFYEGFPADPDGNWIELFGAL